MCIPLRMIRLVLYDKHQNEFEATELDEDYD
jgi:hypothetical protein